MVVREDGGKTDRFGLPRSMLHAQQRWKK